MKLKSLLLIFLLPTILFGQRPFTGTESKSIINELPPVSTSAIPTHVVDSMYRWQWDSVSQIWTYKSKIIYTYDQSGNTVNELSCNWDGSNWINSVNIIQNFDSLNNITLHLFQKYNGINWYDTLQTLYYYDNSSNLIEWNIQNWDGNSWIVFQRYLMDFDSAGNKIQVIYQNLDSGIMQNNYKKNFTYNSNNLLTHDTLNWWISNSWMFHDNHFLLYDSVGNNISMIYQLFDSSQQAWFNHSKNDYAYDTQNNNIYQLGSIWSNMQWEPISQNTKSYDSNNNIILNFGESYVGGGWQNWYEYLYIYDINNNLLEQTLIQWDDTMWVNSAKFINIFDFNNNRISYKSQYGPGLINTDSVFYYFGCLTVGSEIFPVTCGSYTSPSGNYTWTVSGVYTDTLSTAAGCDSIITINLTISPLAVTVTPQGPTTFCQGDSVILNAPSSLDSYQWYHFNNPISGANLANFTAFIEGPYYCVAQDSLMCSGTSNAIYIDVPCIPVGGDNERLTENVGSGNTGLFVSPNPGNGLFNVVSEPGELQIFNILGKEVLKIKFLQGANTVDLTGFSDGIYLFFLNATSGNYLQKVFLNK